MFSLAQLLIPTAWAEIMVQQGTLNVIIQSPCVAYFANLLEYMFDWFTERVLTNNKAAPAVIFPPFKKCYFNYLSS